MAEPELNIDLAPNLYVYFFLPDTTLLLYDTDYFVSRACEKFMQGEKCY